MPTSCFQLSRAAWGQPRAQGDSASALLPLGSPGVAGLGRAVRGGNWASLGGQGRVRAAGGGI